MIGCYHGIKSSVVERKDFETMPKQYSSRQGTRVKSPLSTDQLMIEIINHFDPFYPQGWGCGSS